MSVIPPLSMSQTKDDLLKHLNLPLGIYALMAKETDHVYKWLTRDPAHLKRNCKGKPPYDWSDIAEKAKDDAMTLIAENCDSYTSYYWKIAVPTTDCPNWIAKWFLYHKFRYRDGRNKNSAEDRGHTPHRHNGSHHSRSQLQNSRHPYVATEYRTSFEGTVSVGSDTKRLYPQEGPSSWGNSYYSHSSTTYTSNDHVGHTTRKLKPFDPIRDV